MSSFTVHSIKWSRAAFQMGDEMGLETSHKPALLGHSHHKVCFQIRLESVGLKPASPIQLLSYCDSFERWPREGQDSGALCTVVFLRCANVGDGAVKQGRQAWLLLRPHPPEKAQDLF
uniref:Uncharacterized protein n=1 Tax=Sphaerodactylus townsendi TaxID=933632 RepID=A0ACB8EB77_9SAUR